MSDTLFNWIAAFTKAVVVFAAVMSMVPVLIWLERKLVAWMQQRRGPNRCGPFGLLQPIADAVKLVIKENVFPSGVDRVTYFIAPLMSFIPALTAFAVVPFGDPVTIFGLHVDLQISGANIGVLFMLALSSLAVYGAVLAGRRSNNKYSLLGGLRTSAQMISYEIPSGLTMVTIVLLAGSLNLKDVVDAQAANGVWNILPQFLGFVIFLIASIAEMNRAPFDMGEAESELVAGYHTEYSGFRFAMFYMGEYVNMVTLSALGTVLFLGGWHGPVLWPIVWFVIKIFAFIFLFMWIRATLPRIRYDLLMAFGWKVLIPSAIANMALTAVVIVLAGANAVRVLIAANLMLAALIAVVVKVVGRRLEQAAPVIPVPGHGGAVR